MNCGTKLFYSWLRWFFLDAMSFLSTCMQKRLPLEVKLVHEDWLTSPHLVTRWMFPRHSRQTKQALNRAKVGRGKGPWESLLVRCVGREQQFYSGKISFWTLNPSLLHHRFKLPLQSYFTVAKSLSLSLSTIISLALESTLARSQGSYFSSSLSLAFPWPLATCCWGGGQR